MLLWTFWKWSAGTHMQASASTSGCAPWSAIVGGWWAGPLKSFWKFSWSPSSMLKHLLTHSSPSLVIVQLFCFIFPNWWEFVGIPSVLHFSPAISGVVHPSTCLQTICISSWNAPGCDFCLFFFQSSCIFLLCFAHSLLVFISLSPIPPFSSSVITSMEAERSLLFKSPNPYACRPFLVR